MDDAEFEAHLYAHQKAAVNRMVNLETRGEVALGANGNGGPNGANGAGGANGHEGETMESRVGFYTDPPGSGKTRGIIGLVLRTANDERVARPALKCDFTIREFVRVSRVGLLPNERLVRTTVVLVSGSLVAQWERELLRSATVAASLVVVRRVADAETITTRFEEQQDPLVVLACSRRYDVVSAKLAQARVVVRRMVVDEARRLDGSFGPVIQRDFLWLVSAAPTDAEAYDVVPCHSRCFWSGLRGLARPYFEELTVRTPDAALLYACAVTFRHYECALDSRVASAVRDLVPAAVRERLEANDMQAALAHLGGGSDLMTVVRRRAELDLEQVRIDIRRIEHVVAAFPTRQGLVDQMATLRAKEARIIRDVAVAEDRFRDALQSQCAICHDDMTRPVLLTCCQNLYCAECILSWIHIRGRCPSCRSDNLRVEPINDGVSEAQAQVPAQRARTKAQILIDIVNEAQGGVIVYSAHVDGLATAHTALAEAGITVGFIKGMSSTRDKRIAEFTTGRVKVLLLDAQINCAGLDLLSLTDVVLYHDMPADMKTQIIGRGRRINRTTPMTAHCLFPE
jgi:hypothetical protein